MKNDSQENELTQTILQVIKEEKPQTVNQLVDLTEDKIQIPKEKILRVIVKLQKEKRITLVVPSSFPPTTFEDYLKTFQSLWYWLTLVLTFATVISVFTVPENAYPLVIVRYVLGSVFVLWLPGYTFTKALFPQRPSLKPTDRNLDVVERAALSMGMSLALVPMVGLVLNYTPWGIRLTPIVLSLAALTLTFATIALLRENHV